MIWPLLTPNFLSQIDAAAVGWADFAASLSATRPTALAGFQRQPREGLSLPELAVRRI